MSRCTHCKYDECNASGVCYDTCPMYIADNEYTCCKCVMYDFDKNEDCPYFVDRRIDNEI